MAVSPPPSPPILALVAGFLLAASPLSAQVYPGVQGEPAHMDVSCLCNPDIPPSGEYFLSNDVARAMGQTVPTGDRYRARVEVTDCGQTLRLVVGSRTITLTRQMLGATPVYRGPYTTDDGMRGTFTLVVAESVGLPFEPAVRATLRGEAEARGVRFPLMLKLESPAPESFEACKCALMARYFERIAQYRQSFSDRALIDEAKRRGLSLREFQTFAAESRKRRRDAFDQSLGRTADDDIPGGGGSTTPSGVIHVDDLDMLDRGVPPEMIESVHVHERVHQRERQKGEAMDSIEELAREEVEASEAQLDFIESWLQGNCPRWRPPVRVF